MHMPTYGSRAARIAFGTLDPMTGAPRLSRCCGRTRHAHRIRLSVGVARLFGQGLLAEHPARKGRIILGQVDEVAEHLLERAPARLRQEDEQEDEDERVHAGKAEHRPRMSNAHRDR